MNYEAMIQELAPCGLDCSRCQRYRGGEISRLAADLRKALGNVASIKDTMIKLNPAYEHVEGALKLLEVWSEADCPGCRNLKEPCLPTCAAQKCHKEKGVDFCGQCAEFPCERNRYHKSLEARWWVMGEKIRELGVETFYQESKKKPRYP